MSRELKKYAYRVTHITAEAANCEVGSIIVDTRHTKDDEPYRTWEFASMETGEPTGAIVGKYLGDLETVRRILEDE